MRMSQDVYRRKLHSLAQGYATEILDDEGSEMQGLGISGWQRTGNGQCLKRGRRRDRSKEGEGVYDYFV